MPLAARSNPSEARVPCPVCRAPIHPIAGRCKHCKSDLTAARGGRSWGAPVATALPALGASPAQPAAPRIQAYADAAPAPAPAPVPAPQATPVVPYDPTRVPPRPSGRPPAARASWWQSWPLVVIIIAGAAIALAVVLLLLPTTAASAKELDVAPAPPAPERMDTSPIVPGVPRSGDPWQKPAPAPAPSAPTPLPDIDIPDDPAATDPDPGAADPDADPPAVNGTGAIVMLMMRHACDRARTCNQLDGLKDYCEMVDKLKTAAPPPSCAAARRCVELIDQLSCTADFSDVNALSSVMYKFQDCVAAMNC